MKKILAIGVMFSALVLSAASAGVTVGTGDLKIGAILQAGFTHEMEDAHGFERFTLNRARLLFWGTVVPDKVKAFVQTEHKGGVGVLDYKAQFFYIPQTEITVGRFLPNFTLYMPAHTGKLEMINYPQTTLKYAMWRQVGIQTSTQTDYVDFNVGVFNGADAINNIADNNDAKDFLVRAEVKPPIEGAKVRAGGFAWMGNAKPLYQGMAVNNPDEETLKNNRFGGFAKADYKMEDMVFKFRGELVMGQMEQLTAASVDTLMDVDSQAYFAHVGFQPNPKFEILARYEAYDPNTDVDDDGVTWITVGANYYLEGINSMFYLNYISKSEEGTEVDDDIVQAQVQICL